MGRKKESEKNNSGAPVEWDETKVNNLIKELDDWSSTDGIDHINFVGFLAYLNDPLSWGHFQELCKVFPRLSKMRDLAKSRIAKRRERMAIMKEMDNAIWSRCLNQYDDMAFERSKTMKEAIARASIPPPSDRPYDN